MTVHVGGLVLAAGAGTRFGMPKVLAGGGQWLRNAVAALDEGGCDDIVVVLGAAVVDVPAPARPVTATDWAEGMSASLRAGISALSAGSADYAVVLTVDTPDIGADPVRRVLDAARASGSGIARACYEGRPGHPVVIGRRHWAQLLATLHGDEGARAFLRSRSDVMAVDCADLATGADIDVNQGNRDAQRLSGEAAHRPLRHFDGFGVVADGGQRRRGRIQRHLRDDVARDRFADVPPVAGIRTHTAQIPSAGIDFHGVHGR